VTESIAKPLLHNTLLCRSSVSLFIFIRPSLIATLFPYTTLFRSNGIDDSEVKAVQEASKSIGHTTTLPVDLTNIDDINRVLLNLDRKSTRLNSSHVKISYAVFCLKKKTERKITHLTSTHLK